MVRTCQNDASPEANVQGRHCEACPGHSILFCLIALLGLCLVEDG